ncbi:MAG: MBOAT family protein [Lachnospiraceae bacterium]|nr:MBOAT family protein [Lachnospiraceae bacterium]
MVFNSYSFVFVFLPAIIILYHLINRGGHYTSGKVVLLAASVLFYFYGGFAALAILTASLAVNYCLCRYLIMTDLDDRVRRFSLSAGIILNIGLLIYFKYLGFFESILNSLFKTGFPIREVLLPLGISYYTFSQITFLVDGYREPDKQYSLLDYALFVTFFPKISVGPIAVAKEMIPQFNDLSRKKVNYDNIAGGIVTFTAGLSKKVLLADNLAPYANWGFSHINDLGTTNAIISMLAYTMQIYFDFSGYCDMAKAICLMLNLDLPDNFLSPYRAVSVADFWKRWHITLTNFFTRYVYIPLGGNRKGRVRTYINMFIIFFLSGLWHGAAYTFIIWGLIHGIGISLSKLLKDRMKKIPHIIRCIGTFLFVNVTWIIFRSENLAYAIEFLRQLFSFKMIPVNIELVAEATPDEMQFLQWFILNSSGKTPYLSGCIIIIGFLLIASFISVYCKNSTEWLASLKLSGRTAATTVILLIMSILSLSGVSEFIYTNF